MRRSKDAVILVVLLLTLIVGGIFIARPEKAKESKISTTYNADPMGVKAFYTLLQSMDYSVGRLRKPYDEIPEKARTLIVVQPNAGMDGETSTFTPGGEAISDSEREALTDWVTKGGTVIFLADELKGVPSTFGSPRKLGKGQVYAFPSRDRITNQGMRRTENAIELLEIIDKHTQRGDLILFDEYHHGVVESESLLAYMSRQAWAAVGIMAGVLILFIYSKARRFGAVRSLPSSEEVRPGHEFVESVARLYRRAQASDLAAGILCDSFKHGLCGKLGISTDAELDRISLRIADEMTGELAARAIALVRRCDSAGESISEKELVDVAREVSIVEKELGIDRQSSKHS